ncbi:unnamed protein product [Prorocentrum cordatum]|uniref:Uncharacterized protein n=1 Tax=Prorocentrum cordatum TaxID=2364126 RepID=A0ABN9SRN4_9DINO|nr:unnamed protein product [Polarella glacialis]
MADAAASGHSALAPMKCMKAMKSATVRAKPAAAMRRPAAAKGAPVVRAGPVAGVQGVIKGKSGSIDISEYLTKENANCSKNAFGSKVCGRAKTQAQHFAKSPDELKWFSGEAYKLATRVWDTL